MKDIWRNYIEKRLSVDNEWDGEVDCPNVRGPCFLFSEEKVAVAIKVIRIEKSAGGLMKTSGDFITELINNIVKNAADYWRNSTLMRVYKECHSLQSYKVT